VFFVDPGCAALGRHPQSKHERLLDRKNPLLPAWRVWSYSAQLLEPRMVELTEVDIILEG